MPEIKLEHVTKRWGKFYAVEDLDLTIEDNAFVTLLGPSGCGKTTTLRMIAGLETPTSGKITIGDKVVFDSDMGIKEFSSSSLPVRSRPLRRRTGSTAATATALPTTFSLPKRIRRKASATPIWRPGI